MPRDASGNYTLPAGNPVADGTIIDVNWANPTMSDIAVQLNNVFTRDGLLGPTASFKIIDGTVSSPGLQFNGELSSGIYRPASHTVGVTVNGTERGRFTDDGLQVTGNTVTARVRVSDGSATEPSLSFWADQDTGFFRDASGNIVVVVNGVEVMKWTPSGASSMPTGTVIDHAGGPVPGGFLLCDGSAVSRSTYANLFAQIGTIWGVGDGSTTFNVPDLRRIVVMGAGGTASPVVGNAVGNKGGEETVTLTTAQVPSHTHGVSDPTHAHGVSDPGHAHGVSDPGHSHQYSNAGAGQGQPPQANANNNTGGTSNTSHNGTGISIAGAATGIAIAGAGTGISIVAAGGGGSHNNVQPVAVMNKLIKT